MILLFLLVFTSMMPKGKSNIYIKPLKDTTNIIYNMIYADDYGDLQDAINAIEDDDDGGTILLTPGKTYIIENPPLRISKSGLTIKSDLEGHAFKIIIKINKDTNGIEIISGVNSIKLKGFTLKGKNDNHYNGIYAVNTKDIWVENITITNFGKNGWLSNLIWGSTFIRANINNIRGHGWNIRGGTSDVWINCYVNSIDSTGFKITCWYGALYNCSADWVKGCAYAITNSETGQFSWNTTAYNCGAERCDGKLIHLNGGCCGFENFHARQSGDSLHNDAIITIGNLANHTYLKNFFIYDPRSAYTFDFPVGSIRLENFHPYCFDVDSVIFKSKNADIIWDYADRDTLP